MVIAVDKRYLGIALAQFAHRGNSGESAADDDHLGSMCPSSPRQVGGAHAAPRCSASCQTLRAFAKRLRERGVSRSSQFARASFKANSGRLPIPMKKAAA